MTKAQIISSHQERNIMNEKNILAECTHPFVLEQICTYQVRMLYMYMCLHPLCAPVRVETVTLLFCASMISKTSSSSPPPSYPSHN